MVGPESSVTAMSGRRPRETWNFARLGRVARASLLMVLMGIGSQSCLVTSNPDIEPPKRTPPYFSNLSPPTYQVQKLTSLGTSPSSVTEIGFDVVSEDVGQPIFGAVYLDFNGFGDMKQKVIGQIKPAKIPAGHMTDPKPRPGSATFEITGPPGCHSATLVLSHEFNGPGDPQPTDRENDTALATWWYFLDDDPIGPAVDIATCVTPASPRTDAGSADASDGGR
jgi:hypothetical protein